MPDLYKILGIYFDKNTIKIGEKFLCLGRQNSKCAPVSCIVIELQFDNIKYWSSSEFPRVGTHWVLLGGWVVKKSIKTHFCQKLWRIFSKK
jgi:hypothetical protein